MIFEQQNVKDCENLLLQRNASFILRHWRTTARVPVSDVPMAAAQIESKAKAVLNALGSISIKKGSSPTEIRALR